MIPKDQVMLIAERLKIEPEIDAAIIDPCAGTGNALKLISQHLKKQKGNPVTYGIEKNPDKAVICKEILDYAIKAPYETARATPKAFSMMWLDPPNEEGRSERSEVTFLRNLTDPISGILMEGGVLCYVIDKMAFPSTIPILAARFDDLKVYKLDLNHLAIFGIRRSRARQGPEAKELRESLKAITGIPSIKTDDSIYYQIQPSGKKITFRGPATDPEEIALDLPDSPTWEELPYVFMPFRRELALQAPILPLKPAHDAIAIAAGVIGGNMGNHLLVGRTKKVKNQHEEIDIKKLELEKHVTNIRVFTKEGVHGLE